MDEHCRILVLDNLGNGQLMMRGGGADKVLKIML